MVDADTSNTEENTQAANSTDITSPSVASMVCPDGHGRRATLPTRGFHRDEEYGGKETRSDTTQLVPIRIGHYRARIYTTGKARCSTCDGLP